MVARRGVEGTLVVRDRYLDDIEMRLLPLISIMCLARRCADCRAVDSNAENSFGRQGRKFSVDELLNTRFPHGISDDVDVDVCKAGKRFEFFSPERSLPFGIQIDIGKIPRCVFVVLIFHFFPHRGFFAFFSRPGKVCTV